MVDPSLKKPELLLHVCCIGCGAHVGRTLNNEFDFHLYFYNPNIFPAAEYEKRLAETERVAGGFFLPLIVGEYDHAAWLEDVKGRENDPEKGGRCYICYRHRLLSAAKSAKERGYGFFSTTLTVSPHKDARAIDEIGLDLSRKWGVEFLNRDFKKGDGFK